MGAHDVGSSLRQGGKMDARIAAGMQELANVDLAVQSGRLRGERRRRARRRLDFAAYESVAERNAEFAAACGACVCLGEESHCLDCGGEGRPGWQVPDENLFRLYVAPVLERLGLQRHDEEAHHALSWAAQAAS